MEKRSPISSHKHSFFKVLTSGSLHNVFIPPAFMAQLSGEKMKVATLTSSKGSGNQSWPVRLKKGEKSLYYFRKGWIEFMNDHDLKIGEVLLFEHEGALKFDVFIFDTSTCEKRKFPASLLKQIKEERSIDDDVDAGKEERCGDEDEYPEPQRGSSHNAKHPKRDQSAIEAAKAYITPHSPHFMAIIHTSNLNYKKPYLNIPSTFVSLIEQASPMGNVITIRDPDQGMIWSVDFHYRKGYSGTNAGKRVVLRAGWNDFSGSRNLKVGDVCVFELDTEERKNGIIILNVHIFRG